MNIGLLNSFQFMRLLFDLLNEAEKTQKDSADYYLYLVINSLPFVVRSQLPQIPQILNLLAPTPDESLATRV